MLIVGIAAALWTASGYVGAFMRAANVIYEVEEGRSIVKLRPLQMLVTLVLVLLLALVLWRSCSPARSPTPSDRPSASAPRRSRRGTSPSGRCCSPSSS